MPTMPTESELRAAIAALPDQLQTPRAVMLTILDSGDLDALTQYVLGVRDAASCLTTDGTVYGSLRIVRNILRELC